MDPIRERRRRVIVFAGVGVLVAAAIPAGVFVPPMVRQRAYLGALEDAARQLDALTLELERCVAGDVEPVEYAAAITERVLTDRAFQNAYAECLKARRSGIIALFEAVGSDPSGSFTALDELADPGAVDATGFNPGRAEVCMALTSAREDRRRLWDELGQQPPELAEMTCPGFEDYEHEQPRAVLPPVIENDRPNWRLEWIDPAGVVFARASSAQVLGGYYARIPPAGATEVVELPERYSFENRVQWAPPGVVGLVRPDDTRYDPGSQPFRLEVLTGREIDVRARFPGVTPEWLWVTPSQWFLAVIGEVRGQPTALGFRRSDDEGHTWKQLNIETPASPLTNRFDLSAHPLDSGLLVLATRRASSGPGRAEIVSFRLDGSDPVRGARIELAHTAGSGKFQGCVGEGGAFAMLDGEHLVHVPDEAGPALAHTFEGAERLNNYQFDIACHGEHAIIYARRQEEPDPGAPFTGIQSSGGPLLRFVCTLKGCDAGTLVTDWALAWDVQSTEEGTRALVDLHVAPEDVVYVVDEPVGGTFEQRRTLTSYFAPLDVVVWDSITFGTNLVEDTSRWF